MSKAEEIVKEILNDLTDRGGLDDAWYEIDEETQDGILDEWKGTIENHLENKTPDKIAEDIIRDLKRRNGLENIWDEIDEDIQKEILDEWEGIVKKHV